MKTFNTYLEAVHNAPTRIQTYMLNNKSFLPKAEWLGLDYKKLVTGSYDIVKKYAKITGYHVFPGWRFEVTFRTTPEKLNSMLDEIVDKFQDDIFAVRVRDIYKEAP